MIHIHNEYDEIVETYTSVDHMYKVMKSRYSALQNKRHKELKRELRNGIIIGLISGVVWTVLAFVILK